MTLKVQKVKSAKTNYGRTFILEFGPEGLNFNIPIKLQVPTPTGQKTAFLYYYNPNTKVRELQQFVNVVNGVAVFDLHHFSKCGIS